jgi:hypothetical protein
MKQYIISALCVALVSGELNELDICDADNEGLSVTTATVTGDWSCDPTYCSNCKCYRDMGASQCPTTTLCGSLYRGTEYLQRTYDLSAFSNPAFSITFNVHHYCEPECVKFSYSCDGGSSWTVAHNYAASDLVFATNYDISFDLVGCAGQNNAMIRFKSKAQDTAFEKLCVKDGTYTVPLPAVVAETADNKFLVVYHADVSYDRAAANSYCNTEYGTELATVRASNLAGIYAAKNTVSALCAWAWIGLTACDPIANGWEWEDGTAYVDDLSFYRDINDVPTPTETGAILEMCGEGLKRRDPSDQFSMFICSRSYFSFSISNIAGSQTSATIGISLQLDNKIHKCYRGPLEKGKTYSCPFYGSGTTVTETTSNENKISFSNNHPDAAYIYKVKVDDKQNDNFWYLYQSFCMKRIHSRRVGWYGAGHSRLSNNCEEFADPNNEYFESGAFLIDNDYSCPEIEILLDDNVRTEAKIVAECARVNSVVNVNAPQFEPKGNDSYFEVSQSTLMVIAALIALLLFVNILFFCRANFNFNGKFQGYYEVKHIDTDSEFVDSEACLKS